VDSFNPTTKTQAALSSALQAASAAGNPEIRPAHLLTALLALSSYLVTGVVLPYLHVLRYGGSEEETEEDEALEEMDLLEEREEEQLVNSRGEALMTLLTSLFVIMMIIAVILLYRQGTMVYEGALITVVAFMSSFVPLKDMNRHLNAAADLTDIISRLPDQAEKESAS
jgi:ABC-type transport system involved in cytochrome bd biosynthesis fused ATPase/permease subunit